PVLWHAAWVAVRGRTVWPRPRVLLVCALLPLLLVAPWYAWLGVVVGREKIVGSTPVTVGDDQARFTPDAIAWWMGHNLTFSVVPLELYWSVVGSTPPDADPPADWLVEIGRGENSRHYLRSRPDLVHLQDGLAQLYFSLLPGALTLSLCV